MFKVAVRDRNLFFRHGIASLIQEISVANTDNAYFYCKDELAETDIFFIEIYNMESYNYIQYLLTNKKCIIVITTESLTLAKLFIKNRDRVILSDKRHSLIKLTKTIKEAVRLSKRSISIKIMRIENKKKNSLFTPVELYIIKSLKDGLQIVDIAATLKVSIKTVYSRKYNARRKIGAKKDHYLVDFFLKRKKEDMIIYCCFDLDDIHS